MFFELLMNVYHNLFSLHSLGSVTWQFIFTDNSVGEGTYFLVEKNVFSSVKTNLSTNQNTP